MIKPHKLLFVLTDGGRARFVEYVSATGSFVTFYELDHTGQLRKLRAELRTSPPARSFESASMERHSVGRDDHLRVLKEAFMVEMAACAAMIAVQRNMEAVYLASPRRLVSVLRANIGNRIPIAGALAKDLTKAPDHELGRWLNEALFSPLPTS